MKKIYGVKNRFAKVSFSLLIALGAMGTLFCPTAAHSETIDIEITEVPYRDVYAFMSVYFEFGGLQTVETGNLTLDTQPVGFGLRMQSAKDRDIQLDLILGFRKADIRDLGLAEVRSISVADLMIGGRYYPRLPTFALGKNIAARVTLSGAGGMVMGWSTNGGDLGIIMTAGFVFSQKDDPSGLTFEFVYRPLGNLSSYYPEGSLETAEIFLLPSWGFRAAFLFGPG